MVLGPLHWTVLCEFFNLVDFHGKHVSKQTKLKTCQNLLFGFRTFLDSLALARRVDGRIGARYPPIRVVLAQFFLALAVFVFGQKPSRSLGSSDLSHVSKECNMLVLSRKKNESIVINNDITVVVVEIRGDKVRLGIEAPKEVPVHRREVYDAIQENEATQSEVASPELDAAEESE